MKRKVLVIAAVVLVAAMVATPMVSALSLTSLKNTEPTYGSTSLSLNTFGFGDTEYSSGLSLTSLRGGNTKPTYGSTPLSLNTFGFGDTEYSSGLSLTSLKNTEPKYTQPTIGLKLNTKPKYPVYTPSYQSSSPTVRTETKTGIAYETRNYYGHGWVTSPRGYTETLTYISDSSTSPPHTIKVVREYYPP